MVIVATLAFAVLFVAFVVAPTQVQKWHERRDDEE